MRILVYLGHPAHYYTFKNVLPKLKEDGCEVDNARIPYHLL